MDRPTFERRGVARRLLHLWAVSWRHGSTVRENVIVTDISTAGFGMRSAAFPMGDVVFLEFAYGLLVEAQVIWCDAELGECGCAFVEPLAETLLERITARSDIHELTSVAARSGVQPRL